MYNVRDFNLNTAAIHNNLSIIISHDLYMTNLNHYGIRSN